MRTVSGKLHPSRRNRDAPATVTPGFYNACVDGKHNRTKTTSTRRLSSNIKRNLSCDSVVILRFYLVGVENEIQLAHVLEALVERLHEDCEQGDALP